jgi:hypothetical protein
LEHGRLGEDPTRVALSALKPLIMYIQQHNFNNLITIFCHICILIIVNIILKPVDYNLKICYVYLQ